MLIVYVHKMSPTHKVTVNKMMTAVGVKDFEIIDLMTRNYDSKNPHPCITIGTVPSRIVKNSLQAFPEFNAFTGALDELKRQTRKKVLEALQNVAESIESFTKQSKEIKTVDERIFERPHTLDEFKRMWYSQELSHIIINSADKRICIYNGDQPNAIADIYYSVAEYAALLDMMDIFGAKNILIYKEGKREGHEV